MSRGLVFASLLTLLLSGPPAIAASVVTLGGGGAGDNPLLACGAEASHPFQADKVGAGLEDDQLFLDGALAACEMAIAAQPNSPLAQTWLGRVYLLLGRAAEADRLLQEAIAQGDSYAMYLRSRALLVQDPYGSNSNEALDLLWQSGEAGFAPAIFDIAERFELGNGVDHDLAEAFRLYGIVADAGLGAAHYKLGVFHHYGYAVAVDYTAAMSFYEEAVQRGEARGHNGLGQLYEFGQGVEQDYAQAAEHYGRGAELREKMSLTALAYLHEQGLGVEQDYDRSFALLTDAAGQGWGFGQAALALHYLFGQGTAVDAEKAYDLAWSAQRQGVVYAQGILGYMLMQGLGTDRNLASALERFQAGAQQGDQYSANQIPAVETKLACQDVAGSPYEPGGIGHGVEFEVLDPELAIPACEAATTLEPVLVGDIVWLARAYVRAGNYDDAVPLLEQGVNAGNVLAQTVLADMMLTGDGVPQDMAGAIVLFQAAAEEDFPPAQFALGRAYAEGWGVAADLGEAQRWLELAQSYGFPSAAEQLAMLSERVEADPIDTTGFGREGPRY